MTWRAVLIPLIVLLAGSAIWFFAERDPSGKPLATTPSETSDFSPVDRPATQPLQSAPKEVAPVAENLNSDESSPEEDLEMIVSLFDFFLERYDALPTGTNREITNALTGNNPYRVAFVEPGHPAISAGGELLDRWGTPWFFHNLASDKIEVRSAGPDREMFTGDDLTWPDEDF